MRSSIEKQFEKLEKQRQRVLTEVTGWTAAQQRFHPEPGDWSALQVIDHLVKSDTGIVQRVRDQLPLRVPVKFNERFRAILIIGLMYSPARVKVPGAAKMILPEGTRNLSQLGEKWAEARKDWAGLLESLKPEDLSCGVFEHPASGWMNLKNTLSFVYAHVRHHEYQLERLKSAFAAE